MAPQSNRPQQLRLASLSTLFFYAHIAAGLRMASMVSTGGTI